MRVNPSVNTNVQGAQTESTSKTTKNDAANKAARAGKIEQMAKTQTAAPSTSSAEISGKAKDMAKAHAVASATPDVREDRIAELKKRIASGEYRVDSDAVADKMLREHRGL